jgi:membrane protease YdiL (CAAX protease family)
MLQQVWQLYTNLHRTTLVHSGDEPRSETITTLVVATICLASIQILNKSEIFAATWGERVSAEYQELGRLVHWALVTVALYVIPPLIVMWCYGIKFEQAGLTGTDFWKHAWIYGIMLAIMAPVVWFASRQPAFNQYYPFYRQVNRSWFDLLIWEGCYTLQFIALEFFFRGFLLMLLSRSMGIYAIFVMTIPYCMIHFGKPTLEVYASIIAGIALGTVALATQSIWWGAALHIAVAWTMDYLATLKNPTTG